MAKVSLEKDKIKFLLVEGVHQKAIDSLRAAGYTNIEFHKGALDTEELKASIRDAHFIGLRSRTHLTEEIFAAAEKLVAVGCFCIGTNQVDLNAAAKRGIPVFNAPFSNTRSVAELVIGELLLMLRNDREEYEKFWKNFGLQIKFGVYNDFGANKETLQDLLMFYSSKEQKLVTLDEYINRMEEGQEHIYFMSGDKVELIDNLPQVKKVKEKGYEILYLTDNVDEFALQALMNYKEKTFKNISQGDLDLDSEEEKKELEKKAEENKDLLSGIKEVLGDKVKDVKISSRLVDDPVCLSSEEGMSFEMEKVLSAMPEGNPYGMKASRILEINPNHEIFNALQKVYEQDKDAVKDYADLLYDQALLIEGFPIENPTEFSKKICDFMVKASK